MVHAHGRSWTGATMAPEGKDNVKGQPTFRTEALILVHFYR